MPMTGCVYSIVFHQSKEIVVLPREKYPYLELVDFSNEGNWRHGIAPMPPNVLIAYEKAGWSIMSLVDYEAHLRRLLLSYSEQLNSSIKKRERDIITLSYSRNGAIYRVICKMLEVAPDFPRYQSPYQ